VCKIFGTFLKLIRLKSTLIELLKVLMVLQLMKIFSRTVVKNMWGAFLFS